MFSKAANPENIFLGICWQCDQEEDKATCFQAELPRQSQIRIKWMHWKDAQGPCIARYHTQQLWNGEEYYLQIDSHMRFVKDWDKKLIDYMVNSKYLNLTSLQEYSTSKIYSYYLSCRL